DAGRRLAEVREPALPARLAVHASGQEAVVHGRGVRAMARVEPRRRARLASARVAAERRCPALGRGPEPAVPRGARALAARFRSRGLRVDRRERRRVERRLVPAEGRDRPRAPGHHQLHAGAAAELPRRRAARRLLARGVEQRRARVRRQRPRQLGRSRRRSGRRARPLPLADADAAAARGARAEARGGRRMSVGRNPPVVPGDPDADGRRRVVIENVRPEVDCGRFPAKRAIGDAVEVTADVFTDGHDRIVAVLLARKAGEMDWREYPLEPLGNDRWRGEFRVTKLGRYQYTLLAWADRFLSWRAELERRRDPADVELALRTGAELVAAAAARADGPDRDPLDETATRRRGAEAPDARGGLALAALL